MFQPCASSDGHIPSSSPLSWRREPSPFLPARGIFLKLIPAFGGHKFLLEIPLRMSSCTAQGSLPNKTLPQLSPSVFPLHEALFLQTATIPSWSVPDTELFVPLPFPCHQLLFRLSLHLPPACHRLGLSLSLENHHVPRSNHSTGCWRRVGADC